MARKRSIPTTLFASPDFFELSSNTVRLIFIGLILDADDEGRGCAHHRLLARKLDQQPEEVEEALAELCLHGMLCCYEVVGRHFYWLCHWHTYQTLSKPTPSHYPAPPVQAKEAQERGNQTDIPAHSEQQHEEEGEGEGTLGPPVDPQPKRSPTSAQVASALYLPECEALQEIVQEFGETPTLSLLGEAIEARAWIDDQRRNTRQQAMTPAFFRRWLRRSQHSEETRASHVSQRQAAPLSLRTQPAHKPDQYEEYINALIVKYNGPEALAAMR